MHAYLLEFYSFCQLPNEQKSDMEPFLPSRHTESSVFLSAQSPYMLHKDGHE